MSFQSSFYLFGMEKGLNNMFEIEVRYLMHVHRFSYIVYMLERLLESSQGYGKVNILYDVACTLSKHLEVSAFKSNGISSLHCIINRIEAGKIFHIFFDFAIPVFHSYGHKVDCQVERLIGRISIVVINFFYYCIYS